MPPVPMVPSVIARATASRCPIVFLCWGALFGALLLDKLLDSMLVWP